MVRAGDPGSFLGVMLEGTARAQRHDERGENVVLGEIPGGAYFGEISLISGATPNQAKKHRKKAIHVAWKARIGTERKSESRMRTAWLSWVMDKKRLRRVFLRRVSVVKRRVEAA